MKVNGSLAMKKVKELKISRIRKDTMENGKQDRKKVMDSYFILMEAIIKAIFRIMNFMDMDSITGQEKVSIKEVGFITKSLEQDLSNGKMEINMKVNFFMIKCMAKGGITRTMA